MVTRRWWPQEFETLKAQQAAEVEAETQAAFALAAERAPAPGRRPPRREGGQLGPRPRKPTSGVIPCSPSSARENCSVRARRRGCLRPSPPWRRPGIGPSWYPITTPSMRRGSMTFARVTLSSPYPHGITPDAIGTSWSWMPRVSYLRRADYGVGGLSAPGHLGSGGEGGRSGDGVLRCATPTAWVIGRVLVESPEDLPRAQALQQGFVVRAPGSLVEPHGARRPPHGPPRKQRPTFSSLPKPCRPILRRRATLASVRKPRRSWLGRETPPPRPLRRASRLGGSAENGAR